METQALRWDIFCRVIDNHGDMGVCWRLCADLAARGHTVRLWVDDARALDWMAPGARSSGVAGVEVLDWSLSASRERLAPLAPADVWVEAFGCDIAPEFVAARVLQAQAGAATPPVWINLEYLSAEDYVERSHGLPSPVMQGPARGWTKHFFYPGFTAGTGGLLREPGLAKRMAQFDAHAWLARFGVARSPGVQLISLFCYEPALLPQWLDALAQSPTPSHLLVTDGRARAAVQAAVALGHAAHLPITYLPLLDQADFDHLQWACDVNCVRGEDSLVRALWAGKPLVWQLYPQADGAHLDKMEAFLDRLGADPSQRAFHRLWNVQAPALPVADPSGLAGCWRPQQWEPASHHLRQQLLAQPDLLSQLLDFVAKNR